MSDDDVRRHRETSAAIETVALARLDPASAGEAHRFAEALFAGVSGLDLMAASPSDRFGAALTVLNHARERQPGVAKVHVLNPSAATHGWSSPHSVIAIVNDDMPFLVDSVMGEINRLDVAVHLLAHPIVRIERDAAGRMTRFGGEAGDGARRESIMYIEIDRQALRQLDALARALVQVLADVRAAVEDWQKMRGAAAAALAGLAGAGQLAAPQDMAEASAFLEWLCDDQFTFLGYRRYRYADTAAPGGGAYDLMPGSSLGLLREEGARLFDRSDAEVPPAMQAFMHGSAVLMVIKADLQSTVHRRAPMDVIIVKHFDADGRATGEHRFAGLFTSVAYNSSPHEIPLLRRKVERVIAGTGFDPDSHDGKAMLNVLETFPRDELFQYDDAALLDTVRGVLQLLERPRTALFVRHDVLGRFAACLIYTPRERYDSALRHRFAAVLEQAFGGQVVSHAAALTEDSPLARVLLTARIDPARPGLRPVEIEARLAEAARTWRDRLREALVRNAGEQQGLEIARRYSHAFPLAYQEVNDPAVAVADIERADLALQSGRLQIKLYQRPEQPPHGLSLKLMRPGAPIALSDILPLLEHMGLRVISEVPFALRPLPPAADGSTVAGAAGSVGASGAMVYVHDFMLETDDREPVGFERTRRLFKVALDRIWSGAMESDGFNRLVLRAGLMWREVSLLRAICKYLRQAGIPFSQAYMERALTANPATAALLVQRFLARFDPERQQDAAEACAAIDAEIESALDKVSSLDEDRIVRRFLNVIDAMLRTNFFQIAANGWPKHWISFKLDSHRVEELPLPRPMVEVFVYSPHMEGVHLRGGKVARGGIRWSDRREDFRTEILGLMKAQMVKNAVIVPVGSKGGFIVKRPPAPTGNAAADREAMMGEVVECYRTLMRGLLDITDNLAGTGVVWPERTVRLDGDDPYLVVAADKGTATFSDIANGLARDYGFWLDDAFASGGSAGYDHKKMGITARGAWECVKRHFREMDLDTQTTPFTVAGVGDMSGDVFGNGMLRSRAIRLQAAFDHRHIFIDPDPDAERSFAERQRLFDLPRSSWADYDRSLISAGGGVFERGAKSIALSPQMRGLLDLQGEYATPVELIRAILRARVDLLWFGGIGTYVKAAAESQAEAGDRANDALRINGGEIRARVVGEGANLGVTQRGRIEAAEAGVKLNTDALDNSAGVDCSDHEVNIKIALGHVLAAGDMTMKQRNELLVQMTEDVSELVLRDNYQQSQAISVSEARAPMRLAQHARMMRNLELAGKLDRIVEYLPSPEAIAERQMAGRGLTRPEFCVLLAYAKIALFDELIASDLPDDPLLEAELFRYFPAPLVQRYPDALRHHRLRREIIATRVVNSMINRVGTSFVDDIAERTGAAGPDIARAYALARDIYRLRDIWGEIEALDAGLVAKAQTDMLVATQRLVDAVTVWLLHNLAAPFDAQLAAHRFAPQIERLAAALPGLLPEGERAAVDERVKALTDDGAPEELARRMAALEPLSVGCELVRLSETYRIDIERVASVYFSAAERFGLSWLRAAARRLPHETPWQTLATNALADDLLTQQADLAGVLLAAGQRDGTLSEAWLGNRRRAVDRLDRLFADLRSQSSLDLAMLTVAARDLRALIGSAPMPIAPSALATAASS